MALKITGLSIQNFLSVGNNPVIYEFEHSTTLISGTNGSGKSMMMDALCFVLFGKPFRKVNKGRLVNTVNDKNCLVRIWFEIGDRKYEVVRGIKPNIAEIICDGQLVPQHASVRDYQDYLERQILRTTYKTFCQLVILGSANWQPFMSLSALDRRKMVEDILDIEVFSMMNTILKERISENSRSYAANHIGITTVSERIKHVEETRKMLEDKSQATIDRIEAELAKEIATADDLSSQITKLEEQHEEVIEVIDTFQPISEAYHKCNDIIDKAKKALAKDEELVRYYETTEICRHCGQDLSEKFVARMKPEAEALVIKSKATIEKTTAKQTTIRKHLKKLDALHEKRLGITAALNATEALGMTSDSLIAKITHDLRVAKKEPVEVDSDYDEAKLAELEGIRVLLLQERERMDVAALLLKDSGIKARIVSQYIPMINKSVNEYLKKMNFFVKFTLDENFEETIKAQHKESYVYELFSQGEKMRIDLALLHTWRDIARHRNQSPCNLLILDEIMDGSLDTEGTEDFMRIILNLTKDNVTFIISHKAEQIYDMFEHVIKVTKVNNFTRTEHLEL